MFPRWLFGVQVAYCMKLRKTFLICSSGGHTTEMIMLLQKLSSKKHKLVHCILAQTDATSLEKINAAARKDHEQKWKKSAVGL